MSSAVAGVDGGATRSRAVIFDAEGRSLGRALGGPAVAGRSPPGEVADAVGALVLAAAEDAGVELPLRALWAGLAGTGREEPRRAVERALEVAELAREVRVSTDVDVAHHDAFQGGPGLLLVAGTGSVALGMGEDGHALQIGGWGPLLGDEGSGYRMGLEALRAVARESDGRGPATRLTPVLFEVLELEGPGGLVSWVSASSSADVAALAPVVVRMSEEGDAVAGEMVAQSVDALREHLFVLLKRLGPWSRAPEVAMAGGLLDPGGPMRQRMEAVARSLGLRPCMEPVDAARGAARLALEL